MAHWKARGRLPVSANWTFVASYHGWGTMSGYWSKSLCSRRGGGHIQRKFQEKRGVQVADLRHKNFKSSRVMRWWLSRLSSRFGAKSSRERKPKWLPRLCKSEGSPGRLYLVLYWWFRWAALIILTHIFGIFFTTALLWACHAFNAA